MASANPAPKSLSVCMIVKNEEADLGGCLAGIRPVADEIIVVDTGSTDRTREIAAENGVSVFESPWENSFSQARNVSLNKASKDWILWLDADDRIPAEELPKIAKLKTAPLDRSFGFHVFNNREIARQGSSFLQTRMFPNRDDIRFERRIHEQIVLSLERAGITQYYVDVAIIHTGYADPEILRQKSQRALHMLEMELQEYPEDVNLLTAASDSYMVLGNTRRAIEMLHKANAIPGLQTKNRDFFAQVPALIANLHLKRNEMEKAEEYLAMSLKRDPANLTALYLSGEIKANRNQKQEALALFERVTSLPYEPKSYGLNHAEIRQKARAHIDRLKGDEAAAIIPHSWNEIGKLGDPRHMQHQDRVRMLQAISIQAKSYRAAGKTQLATDLLKEGIKLEKGPFPSMDRFVEILRTHGEVEAAEALRQGCNA